MKASEIAQKLRDLADGLEKMGDTYVGHTYISISANKENLRDLVKALPKPLTKKVFLPHSTSPDLHIEHRLDAGVIMVTIPQSLTCRLVEPAREAKYECDSILSPAEDAEIFAEVEHA